MLRTIIIAMSLLAATGWGQGQEISLLYPPLDYSVPAVSQKELIVGEVNSLAAVKDIRVALVSGASSRPCPCSVYSQSDNTRAMFKASGRITPPYSVISVTVDTADGQSFHKEFPIRASYYNNQYKLDFDLVVTKKVHQDAVRCLEFSNDHRYLVSCGDDSAIQVLNPADLEVLKTFKGHEGYVRQARLTPDNRYIVSCGDDKTVKVWDFNNGELVHTFSEHTEPIYALAISPDGRRVATATYRFRVWDLERREEVLVSEMQKGQSNVLLYTPDGRYLISGDQSQNIVVWDVEKNESKYVRDDAHKTDVVSLALHPSGRYLYSGSKDQWIKWWTVLLNPADPNWDSESNPLWEMRLNMIRDRKKDPAEIPIDVIKSNAEQHKTTRRYPVYILTKAHEDLGSTEITKKAEKPYSSFDLGGDIAALSFTGTGEFLLVVTEKGEVRVHETFTALKKRSFLINHPLLCGSFSRDGSMAAVGGTEGRIWLYGISKP